MNYFDYFPVRCDRQSLSQGVWLLCWMAQPRRSFWLGNLRSIYAQAASPRLSPISVASYSPLFRFVLVDALFWRLTNTWIKNNTSRQNSERKVGWRKISIPENLELEIWTGVLQPGVTSWVLRLDSPTNQWVFISKHSSHLCETWQAGSFPRLQPFDELFYCKSQWRGSSLPCHGQSLSLKMGNNWSNCVHLILSFFDGS